MCIYIYIYIQMYFFIWLLVAEAGLRSLGRDDHRHVVPRVVAPGDGLARNSLSYM